MSAEQVLQHPLDIMMGEDLLPLPSPPFLDEVVAPPLDSEVEEVESFCLSMERGSIGGHKAQQVAGLPVDSDPEPKKVLVS